MDGDCDAAGKIPRGCSERFEKGAANMAKLFEMVSELTAESRESKRLLEALTVKVDELTNGPTGEPERGVLWRLKTLENREKVKGSIGKMIAIGLVRLIVSAGLLLLAAWLGYEFKTKL